MQRMNEVSNQMNNKEWDEYTKLCVERRIEYPVIFLMECEKRKINALKLVRDKRYLLDSETITLEQLIRIIESDKIWP